MVVVDEEQLTELINQVNAVIAEQVLHINASKTKVMVIDWVRCLLESAFLKKYEKVETIVYLQAQL